MMGGSKVMRIRNVAIAISALLACSAATAQTKYYIRQYVPNTAKAPVAPPAPKDTTCGLPVAGNWIKVPVGAVQRFVSQSAAAGPQAAQQWCAANKPVGMIGACVYQALSANGGVAALYEGYGVGSYSDSALHAANCS
jgi:hypothetical protein